jgi:hypothetical protein
MAKEKWGAGHAKAWFRQGNKEIAQALPAFPDSIRVVEEPGLAGNPTPQEVVKEKGNDPYQEWLDRRATELQESAHEQEREEAGWER